MNRDRASEVMKTGAGASLPRLENRRRLVADGQLLSGSFMDYAMPRADDLPNYTVIADESSPSTTKLLGAKGAGECCATGSTPDVAAAVVDALRDYGVRQPEEMPSTPERVWRAIQENGGQS